MRVMGATTAAALLAASPALAADWRLAGGSDRAVSYLDLSSVQRDAGMARFSRWMVLAAPTAGGADNIRDSFQVECASRHYVVAKAELFEGDRSKGGLPVTMGTAAEGTVMASLVDIACGKRTADGPGVADPLTAGKAQLAADKGR